MITWAGGGQQKTNLSTALFLLGSRLVNMAISTTDSVPNARMLRNEDEIEDSELQDKSIKAGEGIAQESETSDNTQISRWEDDPHNPLNWPLWKKALQVAMISSSGFLA